MKVPIPIANGFYQSDSLPLSNQQCMNWYTNIPQSQALSLENLFGTPGINQLASTGEISQINRGAHVKNGIPYVVNGVNLYSVDRTINPDLSESFSTTSLGTIDTGGRVSMADNGTQLMILIPGGKGYIYNENDATPFQEIIDASFTANGNPQHVIFIDGYFVCTTDSKKWIISSLNDGLTWSALDVATAESDPDVITAPVKYRNQLFITGSETTEAFRNIPNGSGFPFVRANVFLDKGCFAPFSLIDAHESFFMIGGGTNESPAIWRFSGGDYQKISTTAIDNLLAKQSKETIQAAFEFSYADKGAYFIGFTFDQYTFVFDTITQRWHERNSIINNIYFRWRVNSIVQAYNRIIVTDAIDGRIGELSKDAYLEYGNNIQRKVSTQPFFKMGDSIKVKYIEVTTESGVGDASRPDPVISMNFSKDGKTWGYERRRSIGKAGKYGQRAIWYGVGRFDRMAVFQWLFSDPVKPAFLSAKMVIN